uniref:NUC153 domain-containing protein n=1 Tax=Panagrolaimus superbus TaxID=310955 RepID=A0A914Z8K7_9BILA
MEVSVNDNVKIYNLSKGDSIPEWVSSKRRRKLEKQHIGFRRSIRLIQDFEFPDVATTISLTPNGRYIIAAGVYKPMLRCFDVNELSLKFEHGLDAHALKVLPISEDYSKTIVLEEERFMEIYSNGYRHYRFRLPKFNRDMAFCREASDLFVVGAGNEIYRFNLELGQFLSPMESEAKELNCCVVNDYHQLLLCGTNDGRVEAYDHRDRNRVGSLDCVLNSLVDYDLEGDRGFAQQINSIAFKDALTFGVGTSTGHVLLYDLRSTKPLLVKDHQMGLPITKIDFVKEDGIVLSMDSRMLKFWEEDTGKPIGAIEPGEPLTEFVRVPESGLLFFAAETQQMLQYFVPSLGPAPKWCYHLESIVEELDTIEAPAIYDDYKFVTKEHLEEIGLDHLIGTNLLRAHMHGFFIDLRLYNRARTLTQPQAVKSQRRKKLRENMEKESTTIPTSKNANAPKVKANKALAAQLQAATLTGTKDKKQQERAKIASKVLTDNRFASLFENTDFNVDEQSDHFKQMAKRVSIRKTKTQQNDEDTTDEEGPKSGLFMDDEPVEERDDEIESDESDDSSDESTEEDEKSEQESVQNESNEEEEIIQVKPKQKPKAFKFVAVDSRRQLNTLRTGEKEVDEGLDETFGARRKILKKETDALVDIDDTPFGSKSISYIVKDDEKSRREAKQKQHLEERRAVHRSAGSFMKPLPISLRGRGGRHRK